MFTNNPSSEVSEKAIVNIRGYINNQDKMLSSQASDSMKVSKNATQGDMWTTYKRIKMDVNS